MCRIQILPLMAAISAREREAHALMAQSRIRYIFLLSDCTALKQKKDGNYKRIITILHSSSSSLWACPYGVVVITFALHAKDRRFEPS